MFDLPHKYPLLAVLTISFCGCGDPIERHKR